jgi:hypothetical protein
MVLVLICCTFTAGYLLYASINSTVHLVALGGAYEDVVESVANITEVRVREAVVSRHSSWALQDLVISPSRR